jgi:hypothetical protein
MSILPTDLIPKNIPRRDAAFSPGVEGGPCRRIATPIVPPGDGTSAAWPRSGRCCPIAAHAASGPSPPPRSPPPCRPPPSRDPAGDGPTRSPAWGQPHDHRRRVVSSLAAIRQVPATGPRPPAAPRSPPPCRPPPGRDPAGDGRRRGPTFARVAFTGGSGGCVAAPVSRCRHLAMATRNRTVPSPPVSVAPAAHSGSPRRPRGCERNRLRDIGAREADIPVGFARQHASYSA